MQPPRSSAESKASPEVACVPRIRTVDGLRGLAALLVVFDHVVGDAWGLGPWSEQNHGITVFALLTGFLLSSRFLRARLDGRPRPATLSFLRARAARIYPGYWVALIVAAVTVGLHGMGAGDWWRVGTLTQTFGSDTPFEGLPPTWSLSLFFSFYLALPVWSWLRSRSDRPGEGAGAILRREALWLGGLIVFALVVRTWSLTDPIAPDPVFSLLGRADWFAIGMLLSVLVIANARGLAPRMLLAPGRRPGLFLLGALALTAASALVPVRLEELRDQLDTLAAGVLVTAIVLHGPVLSGVQHAFASRPAQALGRWSYGIFLWGYVAQKAIGQVAPGIGTGAHLGLTLAAAIVLGAASWRWVERPASQRLGRGRERAERRPAGVPDPARATA